MSGNTEFCGVKMRYSLYAEVSNESKGILKIPLPIVGDVFELSDIEVPASALIKFSDIEVEVMGSINNFHVNGFVLSLRKSDFFYGEMFGEILESINSEGFNVFPVLLEFDEYVCTPSALVGIGQVTDSLELSFEFVEASGDQADFIYKKLMDRHELAVMRSKTVSYLDRMIQGK